MESKRGNFTAEFNAQVAIEALKGQETLAQLSERSQTYLPSKCLFLRKQHSPFSHINHASHLL